MKRYEELVLRLKRPSQALSEVLKAAEVLQQQPAKGPRSATAPPLLRPPKADGCPEAGGKAI